MKDYLNFEGLTYFFSKLLDKLVSKDDIINDDEIDEICGNSGDNLNTDFIDTVTGKKYSLVVTNGNLTMVEVSE